MNDADRGVLTDLINAANGWSDAEAGRRAIELLRRLRQRRWIVTSESHPTAGWEFRSYRACVVDGEDAAGAAHAYIKAVEDSAAEVYRRYPGIVSDPWDDGGRPTEVGVVPMFAIGDGLAIPSGPDRKHLAEAFDALFDWDAAETVRLPT